MFDTLKESLRSKRSMILNIVNSVGSDVSTEMRETVHSLGAWQNRYIGYSPFTDSPHISITQRNTDEVVHEQDLTIGEWDISGSGRDKAYYYIGFHTALESMQRELEDYESSGEFKQDFKKDRDTTVQLKKRIRSWLDILHKTHERVNAYCLSDIPENQGIKQVRKALKEVINDMEVTE